MDTHRTVRPLSLESDPASTRLTPEEVIGIHRGHRQGIGWNELARTYGVERKQINRIVKGLRWPDLHPTRRPDLYEPSVVEAPMEPQFTLQQIELALDVAQSAARVAFSDSLHGKR